MNLNRAPKGYQNLSRLAIDDIECKMCQKKGNLKITKEHIFTLPVI